MEFIRNIMGYVIYAGTSDKMSAKELVSEAVAKAVNLSNSDLRSMYLRGADMHRANITGAHLGGACLAGASLRGASLVGAHLWGANLIGADLAGADLRGINFGNGVRAAGDRPLLSIGPIGSRGDYVHAWMTNMGVMIRAGCFSGWRDEFAAAIEKTHGDSIHGQEYRAALEMIDKHAELWGKAEE